MRCHLQLIATIILLSGCAGTTPIDDPYENQTAQQIYTQAVKQLKNEDYDAAGKTYQALQANYPYGIYSEQGMLESIYAHYKNGDEATTLAIARHFEKLYPNNPHLDYVYYIEGLTKVHGSQDFLSRNLRLDPARVNINPLKKALTSFLSLVNRFPSSPYAPQGQAQIARLRNILAEHEYQVADFYYQRGAYLAAANRAAGVVSHYSRTQVVYEAMRLAAKAYRRLGLEKRADEMQQLAAANVTLSK